MSTGIELELRGGTARILMRWGDSLNLLDPERLEALDRAWAMAIASQGVRAIELAGEGDAFCAGVDTGWIHARMRADRLSEIVDFVRRGHEFLGRVDTCPVPTVLRLDGHAAGAGAEFACAFDHVIASPRGSLRFPETGIGIHPALGGTQRLPRRIGLAAARWLVLTGRTLRAEEALRIGLVERVVEEDELDRAIEEAARCAVDRTWLRAVPIRELEDPVLRVFASRSVTALRTGPHPGDDRRVADSLRRVRSRAPIALRIADQLIRMATETSLEEGLAAEIRELPTVYATADAFAGIRAAAEGRRSTQFSGR